MCGCSAAGSHGRCAAPRLTGTAQSDKTSQLAASSLHLKLTSLHTGPARRRPWHKRMRQPWQGRVTTVPCWYQRQLPEDSCAPSAPQAGATCTFLEYSVGPNACAPRSCPRPSPTACARWRSGWRSSAARYARPRPAPAGSHAPPRSCAQLTRAAQRRNRRRLASASQASPRDWPAAGNRRRGVPRRVRAEHAGAHG